jgi:CheY-like chemotaxis protein
LWARVPWGSQSWLQAAFKAARAGRKPAAGKIARPPARCTGFHRYSWAAGFSAMMSITMPSGPIAPVFSGHTILVVDDQAQVRSLIRQILEPRGALILEAANGSKALAIRERHQGALSLAIVDFLMPGLNGLDLAAQLSREVPGLKILYMSSAIESIAMESLLRQAPELVLLKPFSPEELVARVSSLLGG